MSGHEVYDSLVILAAAQLDNSPAPTDEEMDLYLKQCGVVPPHMRERIIRDAKVKLTSSEY